MQNHSAAVKKYKTAKDAPWMMTESNIEYGIWSGSGRCFDHKIILANNRDAVIIKNDEQRNRAVCNEPLLNTSDFGVRLIWWRNERSKIAARCDGIQWENCCTIREAVTPNEFLMLKEERKLVGLAKFGRACQRLAKFRKVWQSLAKFRKVRQSLAKFGEVRQSLAKFGKVRQNTCEVTYVNV